ILGVLRLLRRGGALRHHPGSARVHAEHRDHGLEPDGHSRHPALLHRGRLGVVQGEGAVMTTTNTKDTKGAKDDTKPLGFPGMPYRFFVTVLRVLRELRVDRGPTGSRTIMNGCA